MAQIGGSSFRPAFAMNNRTEDGLIGSEMRNKAGVTPTEAAGRVYADERGSSAT